MATKTAVPSRRPAVVVGWSAAAVVVAVVLAGVGAWLVSNRADTIDYQLRTYQVSPDGVSVSFDVSKKPSSVASCVITASSRDAAVIGALNDVVVGPNRQGHRITTVKVFVPVHGTAVSANVESCRVTGTG
jgi:hypothetical protein